MFGSVRAVPSGPERSRPSGPERSRAVPSGPERSQNDYSVCAACRMQDAGCRIGPKMDSSACGAGCRNAGCKIRPKEFVRWVQLHICILHRVPVHSFGPDSAFCILHLHIGVQFTALGLILHSAFCICILHRVQITALGLMLHSAFCICILHRAQFTALFGADSAVSPPEERQRRDATWRGTLRRGVCK